MNRALSSFGRGLVRSRHAGRKAATPQAGGRCAALLAAVAGGACYIPLDDLPTDAVATLDWFFDAEGRFGGADWMLAADSCLALDPARTSITLNERAPDFLDGGGRSRDPAGALSAGCNAASAFWSLTEAPADELRIVLADGTAELVARFASNGQVLECGFPACRASNATITRDMPVPVPAEAP